MSYFSNSFINKIFNTIAIIDQLQKKETDFNLKNHMNIVLSNLREFEAQSKISNVYRNVLIQFTQITISDFCKGQIYFEELDLSQLNSTAYRTEKKKIEDNSKRLASFKTTVYNSINISQGITRDKWLLFGGTVVTMIFFGVAVYLTKPKEFLFLFMILLIIISLLFYYYFNKRLKYQTKLELLQHLINNPNPNLKSNDRMLDFLLNELKDNKDSSQIANDFQKYIKAK